MSTQIEKRMVADSNYEVRHSIRVGYKEILLAEDMLDDHGNFYLVSTYRSRGFSMTYTDNFVSDNYLEAMQDFIGRVGTELEIIRAEQATRDFQAELFNVEHCYPYSYKDNIVDKVISLKAESLRPECRRGDEQLVLVTGGLGAQGGVRGRGVNCLHLHTGEQEIYARSDVLGVVKEPPDWAKELLATIAPEWKPPAKERKSLKYRDRNPDGDAR